MEPKVHIDTWIVDTYPSLATMRRKMVAIYLENPAHWAEQGWEAVFKEYAFRTVRRTVG